MVSGFIRCFLSSYFSVELMANKGTQEGQCQTGTADLAEAVLDCLSTGMKITVGFVFVVLFSSAISTIAAVSSVSAGSAVCTGSAAPVASGSLEVPGHSLPLVNSISLKV